MCSRLSVPERTRDFDQQEDGVEGEGKSKARSCCFLGRSIPVSTSEGEVSQEVGEGPEDPGPMSSEVDEEASCGSLKVSVSGPTKNERSALSNSKPYCLPNEDRSVKGSPNNNSSPSASDDLCLSLPKWCARLFTMVLRSRTPLQSFRLTPSKPHEAIWASAPSLFPVPVLFGDHLGRMPPSSNRRQRACVHIDRATHAMVMALRYVHCGPPVDLSLLGRKPFPLHSSCVSQSEKLFKDGGWY